LASGSKVRPWYDIQYTFSVLDLEQRCPLKKTLPVSIFAGSSNPPRLVSISTVFSHISKPAQGIGSNAKARISSSMRL
jgi:hypothetical protein